MIIFKYIVLMILFYTPDVLLQRSQCGKQSQEKNCNFVVESEYIVVILDFIQLKQTLE